MPSNLLIQQLCTQKQSHGWLSSGTRIYEGDPGHLSFADLKTVRESIQLNSMHVAWASAPLSAQLPHVTNQNAVSHPGGPCQRSSTQLLWQLLFVSDQLPGFSTAQPAESRDTCSWNPGWKHSAYSLPSGWPENSWALRSDRWTWLCLLGSLPVVPPADLNSLADGDVQATPRS